MALAVKKIGKERLSDYNNPGSPLFGRILDAYEHSLEGGPSRFASFNRLFQGHGLQFPPAYETFL